MKGEAKYMHEKQWDKKRYHEAAGEAMKRQKRMGKEMKRRGSGRRGDFM